MALLTHRKVRSAGGDIELVGQQVAGGGGEVGPQPERGLQHQLRGRAQECFTGAEQEGTLPPAGRDQGEQEERGGPQRGERDEEGGPQQGAPAPQLQQGGRQSGHQHQGQGCPASKPLTLRNGQG